VLIYDGLYVNERTGLYLTKTYVLFILKCRNVRFDEDIFAECSIDYDKNAEITYQFYATVQNKFHYAITGKTVAEIIYTQADHTKDHMGLITWKNAPDGRILKSDT